MTLRKQVHRNLGPVYSSNICDISWKTIWFRIMETDFDLHSVILDQEFFRYSFCLYKAPCLKCMRMTAYSHAQITFDPLSVCLSVCKFCVNHIRYILFRMYRAQGYDVYLFEPFNLVPIIFLSSILVREVMDAISVF
jgi:hypothetical protein